MFTFRNLPEAGTTEQLTPPPLPEASLSLSLTLALSSRGVLLARGWRRGVVVLLARLSSRSRQREGWWGRNGAMSEASGAKLVAPASCSIVQPTRDVQTHTPANMCTNSKQTRPPGVATKHGST